jgi:hypothetical protein
MKRTAVETRIFGDEMLEKGVGVATDFADLPGRATARAPADVN